MLPGRSTKIGQKLVENAKIQKVRHIEGFSNNVILSDGFLDKMWTFEKVFKMNFVITHCKGVVELL